MTNQIKVRSRAEENVEIPGFKTLCQVMPSDPKRAQRIELLKQQLRQILRERAAK